ncbi:hypothetical protein [Herbaspirillum sp. RV1423]|uniref:hypothetical protein n=1 Tax=Herbaspirillum sp. RV1423 TaxID=1443993 RepID=UPI0012DD5F69|nr:hypothetical protein [Herbaspirillum sp. RV1423]
MEKEWKSKVDDIYPVVHTQFVPTVPLDESKEALRRQQEASRLEARVIESAKVISEADERHFRLAKEYIKNIFPDMAKSYRDFKWQIEFARVLEEIAKLQDRDFYSAINKEGIHQATTVLLKDKEYKGYQPPSVQDFLELALNKTLVHAFDGIYKKGKPYWSKTPDGTEIDPTGTVKKVPIDITPSIRTDYSGYDVKEFLYQLQKALENPPGDTAAQLMRVHGKWTEDDIVMAKQIGAFVVRAFESLGYIPIIGTPAAVAMVARPIASGMVNFIQRRVNEGGTFGKEDVKDLAGVAWTAVGLRIPAKPAKKAIPFIVGHVAVGEGIARI